MRLVLDGHVIGHDVTRLKTSIGSQSIRGKHEVTVAIEPEDPKLPLYEVFLKVNDETVEPKEREACAARNGWKVILGRCSPEKRSRRQPGSLASITE